MVNNAGMGFALMSGAIGSDFIVILIIDDEPKSLEYDLESCYKPEILFLEAISKKR